MADKKLIESIEQGNAIAAHEMITKSLYKKAGALVEEKRKQIAAKITAKPDDEDEKSKEKAVRRKAFKEKILKEKK